MAWSTILSWHTAAPKIPLSIRRKDQLERAQAEAHKLGLDVQLMASDVQPRQALLAAGMLATFETPLGKTSVA
ncbi:MAG TPA: hypothetical protein VGG72_10745 [Bryobacteraceae bacterium]|jgi:hypothetical protein